MRNSFHDSRVNMVHVKITETSVEDIRFPTSLYADGSDAIHTDPDYSCAYVTLRARLGVDVFEGFGLTFTLGRGTEIGPEKGVTHLAVAAIINALWDLWGKCRGRPVWKLLVEMSPEELVSTIDFRYITDVITKEEAIAILKDRQTGKEEREETLVKNGLPAYTTQVAWMGYTDEQVKRLCHVYMEQGFTAFKVKVGRNLEDDARRCKIVREAIGTENKLMIDANQIWDVEQAIDWTKKLSEFKIHWIEEPTSPDDVLGHAKIAEALRPLGIGVASGEMCANRVMFKQFLQKQAIDFCQIDSARIGGVNEILAVYLMAHKFGIPVCPHAGGVGLCEMVQHLQMWDFVCLSGTTENRMIEFVDQQHEHFVCPAVVQNAHYIAPKAPGYSTELREESILDYQYPTGRKWQSMFEEGIFERPKN
ncbi:mitochondrial enolase superfamily member 1-like isoform X2 [Venturia canescens]|uniref:mitochondrial enolase superfamily member 1-like isoform X2 n=1 Tax=Venturia canescens TaxID=32260 RepID=UPI001C9C3AC6|nr:mitochondrial enolase superfamily member 1-like isoform X2 [Venturia canescens]